jgi:ABC-type antimicrobial peptide transport system permease subunit
LGFFAATALLLACVGLYGVMAYTVTRQTKEIGIRMALGASRRRLVSMVLQDTLRLAVIGVGLGIPAALLTTRFLDSLLLGLAPTDPATVAATALSLLAVSVLAGGRPARRAASVDPIVALRYE